MYHPDKKEFISLAKKGNLIPVYTEIAADFETPLSCYAKIDRGDYSFLLESVEGGEHLGRYSFIGTNPRQLIRMDGTSGPDPLQAVEAAMARYRPVALPGLPRFTGGAVGFIVIALFFPIFTMSSPRYSGRLPWMS